MAKEDVNVKEAIRGLKFRHNQKIEDKDTKKVRYAPAERPMTEDDVLATRREGNQLVIVSKDGTKHRVPV
jgi:hypothetical protein